jgi:hypothetical protein
MLTASRILGTEAGSTAPLFLAFLAIHVLAGITAVASGAIAAIARKGSPRHIRAGRWYYRAITVLFITATILAAMRWRQDYPLFILGAAAFIAATIGYQHCRRHRPGEDHAADIAPGGSRQAAFATLGRQFGQRTAGLVAAVTNPAWQPGRDEREQYREHVTASLQASPWARVIKASDFTDNAVGLIHTTGPKLAKLAGKYRPLVPVLRELILRPDTPLDPGVKDKIARQLDNAEHGSPSSATTMAPASIMANCPPPGSSSSGSPGRNQPGALVRPRPSAEPLEETRDGSVYWETALERPVCDADRGRDNETTILTP